MSKVQKRSPEPLRNVLYRFSMAREVPDPELLDEYVRLYPEYVETLTDFAVQLVVESRQSLTAEVLAPETRVSPVVSRAMSRFQSVLHTAKTSRRISPAAEAAVASAVNPFKHLKREEFRRIVKELQANSVFLCFVRDGMILFGSMTPGFIALLTAAMKGQLDEVTDFLRTQKPVVAAGQFSRADDKPQAGAQITFEEAVKRSGLSPEQEQFLLNL